MPQTTVQRRPDEAKPATARTRAATQRKRGETSLVERTTDLSNDVFQSLEDGGRTAIDAVRKFLETVDKALPPHGDGPSRAEQVADSALEMAQRLVHTQYEFLRQMTDSAGKSLSTSDKRE